MADDREAALAEFKRSIKLIVVLAVLTVIAALTYLQLFGGLNATTIIATTLGVFFSILLGCGLFAAAFFSEKSGLDQQVTDVTLSEREHAQAHAQISKQRSIQ